jgi:hypothetical protein
MTVPCRLVGPEVGVATDGDRQLIGLDLWGPRGPVRRALCDGRDPPFGACRGVVHGIPGRRLRRDEQEEERHGDAILRDPIQVQPSTDSTNRARPCRKQTKTTPKPQRLGRFLGFSPSRGIDAVAHGPEELPIVSLRSFSLSLLRLRCSAELERADRCRKPTPSGDLVVNRLESTLPRT